MCAGAQAPAHYTKKKAKMKKTYFAPEFEEIKLNLQGALLADSEGGINDDNSTKTDDNPSTDPNDDFGW